MKCDIRPLRKKYYSVIFLTTHTELKNNLYTKKYFIQLYELGDHPYPLSLPAMSFTTKSYPFRDKDNLIMHSLLKSAQIVFLTSEKTGGCGLFKKGFLSGIKKDEIFEHIKASLSTPFQA